MSAFQPPIYVTLAELTIITSDAYSGRGSCLALHRVLVRNQQLLYKEYRPDFPINSVALERLLLWHRSLADEERYWLDERAAFPTFVVRDGNRTVGICMPEAESRFFFTAPGETSRRPRPLAYLSWTPQSASEIGHGYYEPPHKLAVLGEILELVLWFHDRNIAVGDLQMENFLITGPRSATRPMFLLLDCDSLWLQGNAATPKQEPANMRCPYGPPDIFDSSTDRYKFAKIAQFCLHENASGGELDIKYMRKLLPSDYVDTVAELLVSAAEPSPQRLRALARTSGSRMAEDGTLYGSNDSRTWYPWTPGEVTSPGALAGRPQRWPHWDNWPDWARQLAVITLVLLALVLIGLIAALHH